MLTNIVDGKTKVTVAVIAGGVVQSLNPFTILVDGVVIEWRDAVYPEVIDTEEKREQGSADQ